MNRAPGRASDWMSPDGLAITERIALDDLGDRWASFYDVGYTHGEYHAFRLIGGPLIAARTVDGLDSAIRADSAREQRLAGYAR